MLYLNPKSRKIVEAKDEFLKEMKVFVSVRKKNINRTNLMPKERT